jgi:hypothetical protein
MPIDPFPYIAVLFYKRPSHLAPSDSASAIDKLWATNIDLQFPENDEKMKKFIVNQTIGAMGRVKNYSTHSQVFVDYAEAMYYKTRYGGTIFAKQRSRLASWVAQGDPEYDELDGEEVNHMKRHNKLVPCLLDCVNLFDDHIYQIHYEAYSSSFKLFNSLKYSTSFVFEKNRMVQKSNYRLHCRKKSRSI